MHYSINIPPFRLRAPHLLFVTIFVTIVCLAPSCVTSPTGRQQLLLMPEEQMNVMGSQAFGELKKKTPMAQDGRVNAYVDCVAKALLRVSDDSLKKLTWELVVFEDASANAFALPSGKIGVHTGLLKVAQNQHQLATVIGHEVGHVLAKHGNERVSQALLTQGGMAIADSLLEERREKSIVLSALGLGAQFGFIYPHSRKQEAEADEIGLLLMAKAGFDPGASIDLWNNMGKASSGQQPPEFLSTHPAHGSRIRELNKLLPKARLLAGTAHEQGLAPQCK